MPDGECIGVQLVTMPLRGEKKRGKSKATGVFEAKDE